MSPSDDAWRVQENARVGTETDPTGPLTETTDQNVGGSNPFGRASRSPRG